MTLRETTLKLLIFSKVYEIFSSDLPLSQLHQNSRVWYRINSRNFSPNSCKLDFSWNREYFRKKSRTFAQNHGKISIHVFTQKKIGQISRIHAIKKWIFGFGFFSSRNFFQFSRIYANKKVYSRIYANRLGRKCSLKRRETAKKQFDILNVHAIFFKKISQKKSF